MEGIVQIDRRLSLWLNQANPDALDGFWHFLSGNKVWFPFYVLLMVFVIWRLGWKKGLAVVLSLIVGVILTDQLSVLVKESVMRLRPCRDPWMTLNGVVCPDGIIGGMYGFFSSHASNVFGLAAGSHLSLKLNDGKHGYSWYAFLMYAWAAAVSLSRVMLAAHYLGDILTGTVFGIAMGTALALLTRLVIVKAKL